MPPKKFAGPCLATDPAQPKPRKPRAPMPRPSDFTNAQWKADVDRRAAVTADRRNRLNIKKAKDAAVEQEDASRAAMANERQFLPPAQQAGQYHPSCSQQSIASPANFSPPVWGYSPSPDYVDGDALGGFDPSITFPHSSVLRAPSIFISPDPRAPSAFVAGLDPQYGYSPTYSGSPAPTLRHEPLPVTPSQSSSA